MTYETFNSNSSTLTTDFQSRFLPTPLPVSEIDGLDWKKLLTELPSIFNRLCCGFRFKLGHKSRISKEVNKIKLKNSA
jgi:hypothetical protein